jgi:hypothetical protein
MAVGRWSDRVAEYYVIRDTRDGFTGRPVVYAVRDIAVLDAAARNREWLSEVVRDANMFLFGPEGLTSLPEPVFRDWLEDHDIPPPPVPRVGWWGRLFVRLGLDADPADSDPLDLRERPEWRRWWERLVRDAQLSAAQYDQLASVLDRCVRYDVVGVPAREELAGGTVFLVCEDYRDAESMEPELRSAIAVCPTASAAQAVGPPAGSGAGSGWWYAVIEATLDPRR